MKYYLLVAPDLRWNNFLIHTEEENSNPLRPRYRNLACPVCNKVDPDEALAAGFDAGLKLRSPNDFLQTEDDYSCVSERFKAALEQSPLTGYRLHQVGDTSWYVIDCPLRVDAKLKGVRHQGRCKECGRARNSTGFPAPEYICVPEDPMTFFSLKYMGENLFGGFREIIVSEEIVKVLKPFKLRGLSFF